MEETKDEDQKVLSLSMSHARPGPGCWPGWAQRLGRAG